jgi:hypothetical protein
LLQLAEAALSLFSSGRFVFALRLMQAALS